MVKTPQVLFPPILAVVLIACSPAARSRAAAVIGAAAGGGGGSATATAVAPTQVKLMIFGGTGHQVYLGCLNCSEYTTDSVKNAYGPHGSAYSQESIFNHYGLYGSPYSTTSACNPHASDPPVIVDQTGKYYGRLTLNQYHPEIGTGRELLGWLQAVCEG